MSVTLEAKVWKRTSWRWALVARIRVTVLLFQGAPSNWGRPPPAFSSVFVAPTTRLAALCLNHPHSTPDHHNRMPNRCLRTGKRHWLYCRPEKLGSQAVLELHNQVAPVIREKSSTETDQERDASPSNGCRKKSWAHPSLTLHWHCGIAWKTVKRSLKVMAQALIGF